MKTFPKCECGGIALTNASGDITRTCISCGGIVLPCKVVDMKKRIVIDSDYCNTGECRARLQVFRWFVDHIAWFPNPMEDGRFFVNEMIQLRDEE